MCGIMAVFNHEQAAQMVALGLFAEQHRGQESCGMAVADGHQFTLIKNMGLVKNVLTPEVVAELKGHVALGHVRYPTRGASTRHNSQPHVVDTLAGTRYALASNGDIVNYAQVKERLQCLGVHFNSNNDGELLLKFLVYFIEREQFTPVQAIKELMKEIKGAYSTVFAMSDQMFLLRDPHALRPMVLGCLGENNWAAASESCSLNILGITDFWEVPPAGIIELSSNGLVNHENNPDLYRSIGHDCHCVFEHIYFSRPDSCDFGNHVFEVREAIGGCLAERDSTPADVVVPVPDSSNYIALGYARRRNMPFEFGLIRNHYVGRTFIRPDQRVRDEGVRQKFNVLPGFFKDKRVIMVDDSIVRGTTLKKLAALVRRAGASEIHLRIGSPQVKYSCFYGIDTPTRDELIANELNGDTQAIAEFLGVDSLAYLPIEDLDKVVNNPGCYCHACFSGQYPLETR